ncbi:MAG: hypothetical protein MUF54_20770 [Polyangiaceae bacterium]|nr:hypothetical protein [Polyangiaceae bacterium]
MSLLSSNENTKPKHLRGGLAARVRAAKRLRAIALLSALAACVLACARGTPDRPSPAPAASGGSAGTDGGDKCTFDCRLDTTHCGGCGNGFIDMGEECDGSNFAGMATCADLEAGTGDLSCTDGCIFDLSGCSACGDGTLLAPEDCEPATDATKPDLGDATCELLGWQGGNLGCDQGCRFDEGGCFTCGDAARSGLEECDGADFGGLGCGDFNDITGTLLTSGSLSCTAACKISTSNCMRCGDGVVTGDEVCEAGVLQGQSCLSQGFSDGSLGCAADCHSFDTTSCTRCGNGVVEVNEQCDGQDLAGATCQSLGAGAGVLSCTPTCAFNTSACVGNT